MQLQKFEPSIPKRIGGLDELRGLAVLFVLVSHWSSVWPSIEIARLGAVGVDIFFVISGFLIGTILHNSKGQVGYFRNFYIRRAFRILPLASAIVFLGIIGNIVIGRPLDSLLYYFTGTQNFIPAFRSGAEYDFNLLLPLVGADPMWSLAVEEQIYAILPILFLIPDRLLKSFIIAIALLGCVFSVVYWYDLSNVAYYTNYKETQVRFQYIVFGVILSNAKWRLLLVPVMMIWVAITLFLCDYMIYQVFIAIIICSLVHALSTGFIKFSFRPLSWIGLRCFGIYLLHYPLALLAKELSTRNIIDGAFVESIAFILYIATTMFAAYLSFRFFEIPLQKKRHYFEFR